MSASFTTGLPLSQRLAIAAVAVLITNGMLQQMFDLGAPERSASIARATLQRSAAPMAVAAASQPGVLVIAAAAP